ncbi:MAG TPA: enoyl-CoA hydratase-related protein [Pseudonocardiaceae bacterium]|nr:enoyl-CoA hydratase-related protein [Pseudonocardiaceae bacterium]
MAVDGEFVRLDVDGGIGTIRLNRPPMNALSRQCAQEIQFAAQQAADRAEVRAVIVYGGEKVFAAGADIKEMATIPAAEVSAQVAALSGAFRAVADIPKPTVAAIVGFALGGGCELALCCDRRIAADNAKIGLPEILLGIIPGAGGTQRLPRLIGPAWAKELIYTGRIVEAAEALRIGLVDEVVPADGLMAAAGRLSAVIAAKSPLGLRIGKEALNAVEFMDMEPGYAVEQQHSTRLMATADAREATRATLEKRPPVFLGR